MYFICYNYNGLGYAIVHSEKGFIALFDNEIIANEIKNKLNENRTETNQ